jgi:hypothetical protein
MTNNVLQHEPDAEGKNQHDYIFDCSGCEMMHGFNVNGPGPIWTFNNDLVKPTISPSLKVTYTYGKDRINKVCHSFITNGEMKFLNDCTHKLAGKTIPLKAIEE